MPKGKREISFLKSFFIAFFLLFVVILNQYLHLEKWSEVYEVLWFCNAAAIGTAIAFLIHSRTLMSSVLIAATAAQAKWIYDFVLMVLFNESAGRTLLYMDSSEMGYLVPAISILLHFILIPLTFYGVYKMGFSLWGIVMCLSIWVFSLLPVSFFMTPADSNINCVFYPCDLSFDKALKTVNFEEHFRKDLRLWASITFINGAFLWGLFKLIRRRKN